MKLLGLDSSQKRAVVCLLEGEKRVAAVQGAFDLSHSEGLLALVDDVLKSAGLGVSELEAFAVGVGPGSFTGIRVGCSTIKTLAQVLGRRVLPFSSLLAMYYSSPESINKIHVNAFGGLAYYGGFAADDKWHEGVVSLKDEPDACLAAFSPSIEGVHRAICRELALGTPFEEARAVRARYLQPSHAELKLALAKVANDVPG